MSGTGSSVGSVYLILSRESDGYYYNGSSWVSEYSKILCTGTLNWSYSLSTGILADKTKYTIVSRVYDMNGGFKDGDEKTFVFLGSIDTEDSLINYPNPFDPETETTTIEFVKIFPGIVNISIVDIRMSTVKTYKINAMAGLNYLT